MKAKRPKAGTSKAEADDIFYVYTLTDPRDGTVFYVGKGMGNRLNSHVADVRAGRVLNKRKHDRIKAILDAGLDVRAEVVARFDSEDDALQYERDRIAIGGDEITNIAAGGRAQSQVARRAGAVRVARKHLSMFPPYHEWVRRRKWGDASKALFRTCFHSLVKSAQEPDFTASHVVIGAGGKAELRW